MALNDVCAVSPLYHLGFSANNPQCGIGAPVLLLAAWLRYAGTARSLPLNGSYALLIVGQVCSQSPNTYLPCENAFILVFCSYCTANLSSRGADIF